MFQNIRLDSKMHKTYKINKLKKLIEENKNLAPQGSPEWLAIREYSIGGSEMSTITGDNPYQKLENLISQKLGFTKFNGNIACRWGKMFEVVTQSLTQTILDASQMCETGSLEGAVSHQRYSPDGLGVVKLYCESEYKGEIIETFEYCIVLFEYKSPYCSIPTGIIPKHYLPQVKTGLCSIPISDFAIFINNVFRKCTLDDLNDNIKYDDVFHKSKKFIPKDPLALGMNIFYQNVQQRELFKQKYCPDIESDSDEECSDSDEECSDSDEDTVQNIFNNIKSKPTLDLPFLYQHILNTIDNKTVYRIDFGKSYYTDFDLLMKLYDDGYISIHYCEPHIFDRYYDNKFLKDQNKKPKFKKNITDSLAEYKSNIDTIDTIQDDSNCNSSENPIRKNSIIGFLPWKLFMSDILTETRDENYVKNHESTIQNTINIIKDIQDSDSTETKAAKFKTYFPSSNILKECGLQESDARKFIPKNI
jgi:hypothetical protein